MDMKIDRVMQKASLFLVLTLLLSSVTLSGCEKGESGNFGIYLVESGELVLSDQHIKAYYQNDHTIELNKTGIERWNSYLTYSDIPKLANSLAGKEFVVKLRGKEMYEGKFYSMVMSSSYSGVVILNALIKLDNEHNTIRIDFGYPPGSDGVGQDPRNNPEIISFVERQGLLK